MPIFIHYSEFTNTRIYITKVI